MRSISPNGVAGTRNPALERCLNRVRSHFDRVISEGVASDGANPTRMWRASFPTRTGLGSGTEERPAEIGERVYRHIHAPGGTNLYWDQPHLLAAYTLSDHIGETSSAAAADGYISDFLERCVAPNGVFLWGNHYYYDIRRGGAVRFRGDGEPVLCDMAAETGEGHEIRPIPPAWEMFWEISPEVTERAIRSALRGHLIDPATGEFQVHAAGVPGNALLETGGLWVESLAWLCAKTGDRKLLEVARKIAAFSFGHRSAETGLIENHPTRTRWDKYTSTTEIGHWANALLRASRHVSCDEWVEMADAAITGWLKFGYDEGAGRYFGRLKVATGEAVMGPREFPYQPGDYSDVWEFLFPSHDYPMSFAECCLRLHEITGEERFEKACRRWANVIERDLPARGGSGGYAENYGKCILFLNGCAHRWGDESMRSLALRVAREGEAVLFDDGVYRGHPGEHRLDAVDGVGYFLLAAMGLYSEIEPNMRGSGW